ncbi:hypothetical protein [Actinokineospora iranica]|uniref:Uncharacterized protein n=1 Tax=Actinokineospora iranica TaxID=1271860 RepID=A0A1G6MWT9_9PSEU|nr:hypothetical protein [Actinokineospora iranica]SDC60030.1 hypothetical protein SAMN05216174_10374 [Actinokineospora iranica]
MTDTDAEVVRAPATDRPALSDATTAVLLRLRDSTRPKIAAIVLLVFSALFVTLSSVVARLLSGGGAISAFGALLSLAGAALSWTGVMILVRLRFASRWIPSAHAQLGSSPWRPVTARVVRTRAEMVTVEVEENGAFTALEVRGLRAAHRSVIGRTGEVWLVGPAADGWAVVRIDGSHEPFPARVRRKPVPPGAVSDPIDPAETSRRWVRWLRSQARRSLGLSRRRRGDLRLPELVEAGEWTRARAWAAPWIARLDGTAEATVTVQLDDGATLTASLPNASVDLLGTVWETGTLWFAGRPEAGKTMAAGFPGYPLLAVARLT